MANVKLSFLGTEVTNTEVHELECFINIHDEITLSISDDVHYPKVISLDVPTAIKLTKVLRSYINEIKSI